MGTIEIDGATPKLTIGNATAEDASIVYDGNAKDFYIALDDSADKLVIGEGSTVGTNSILTITDDSVTIGDAAAVDTKIVYDGNAKDFYIGLDDSADKLVIGEGSTVGTNSILTITDDTVTVGDAAAVDTMVVFDGNAVDYRLGIDDSADTFEIGLGSAHATTAQISLNATGFVFNEQSNDYDFRVESNSYAHCLFVDGGNDRVGVGVNTDTGGLFRVSLGDSGQNSIVAAGQAIVIEDNANTGLSILTPNDAYGSILFGDDGDADRGFIRYNHSGDDMYFSVNGNGSAYSLVLFDGGQVSTGGETAPDTSDGGLCLDQNASDTKILTFKSSDADHPNTDSAETDTYGFFSKYHATDAGLTMAGFSEGANAGLHLRGFSEDGPSVGEATNQGGVIELNATITNGTGTVGPAADGNAVVVMGNGATQFIVKGDGELFSNQSATVGTYDTYDDAQLVRAFDLNKGENAKGLIDSKFDKFVKYNQKDLMDAKLIGKDENGKPTSFVNITGMTRLHNGAIWQQYEKHERLLEAVYDLAKEAVGEEKADAILDKHEVKRLQ